MKPTIQLILHYPPPVHGAAVMGGFIKESEIFNHTFNTSYINLSTSSNNHEVGRKSFGKTFILLKKLGWILANLRSQPADLYYLTLTASGPGFLKDFLFVLILKIFQKKIIYHFHNKGVNINQDKLFYNILYRFTFKNTKSILLSPLLYNDVKKYVNPNDVYYCANGVPDQKIERTDYGLESKRHCKILFLSNMTVEKGVFEALTACKILHDRNLNFECHFVGDWAGISEESFKNQIKELGLVNLVFAHGKKYGDDKLRHLASADIFTLPTHKECFPLVLLEAMQFSLPIVATNEGGIPEIVRDEQTGFIVSKFDALALANKIALLLQNPKLRLKMGAEGRKRYAERYTLAQFEKNFSKVICDALS